MPFPRLRKLIGVPDKEPIDYAALNNPDLVKSRPMQQFGQLPDRPPVVGAPVKDAKFSVLNNSQSDDSPEIRANSDKFIKQQMDVLRGINDTEELGATYDDMMSDPELTDYEKDQLHQQSIKHATERMR